MDLIKMAVCLC